MSIDAPPPSLPPQMSPDGKWIWDGNQWRPIPVHEAAFPNWKGVGAGFVPEVDTQAQAVAVAPARRGQVAPLPSYRLAGPAPMMSAPVWAKASKRLDLPRYGPLAIAAVALVIVIVLVSVTVTLALSRQGAPAPAAQTNTSKGGPTVRSDSALAAYLIKTLDPPVADLKDNTTLVRQTCASGMTSACEDAVLTIANSAAPLVAIVDKTSVPQCVAAPVGLLRTDFVFLGGDAQIALKGFNDNKSAEFATGYNGVLAWAARLQPDSAALKSAAASCDSALTGP